MDYVLDQNGRVAYFSTEYDPDAMTAVIDRLLGNPVEEEDEEEEEEIPKVTPLRVTARPNPFNPSTEIAFWLPQAGRVDLDIHDPRGRLRRRLVVDTIFGAGENAVAWDGTDSSGRGLPSGLYLVQVRSEAGEARTKVTLVR